MPAKSLIEVDVNDQAFREFNALFQRYQQQLNLMPQAWRSAATAQQQSLKGTRSLSQAQAMLSGQLGMLADDHRAALLLLRQEEASWERIRRSTAGSALIIKNMTGDILKWVPVLSALAGLGGIAGLSVLAGNVAGGRRSALGLGATYGGQRAFATAFDRFVDPSSVLSGVASARGDVAKRVAFSGLGMLNDKDLQGDDAAVAARVLERTKRLADKTHDQFLGNVFEMYQLGTLGLTEQDFRRLKHTSTAELTQQERRFGTLSRDYNLNEKDQRAYQDFQTALTDASNRIENVFVKGLVPLIPGMEKLSASIVRSIENLSNAIPPGAMERIGKGIEAFAQYLGGAKFQSDVKAVGSAFAWFAGKVRDFGIYVSGDTGAKGIRDRVAWSKHHRDGLKTVGELKKERAEGKATAFSQFANIFKGTVGTSPSDTALPTKAGAGTLDPGLASLAKSIRGRIPNSFGQITAGEDEYHKGFKSAHNEGRAFDFTIKNPAQAAEVAQLVRDEMARQGIKGKVIDEYSNPSKNATGGHIHVQTDVRIMNQTGNNVVVQTQQAIPSP